MEPTRSRFAGHKLADRRWSHWIDAVHANIVEVAPAREVCEQPPHDVNWGIDEVGRAGFVGGICQERHLRMKLGIGASGR